MHNPLLPIPHTRRQDNLKFPYRDQFFKTVREFCFKTISIKTRNNLRTKTMTSQERDKDECRTILPPDNSPGQFTLPFWVGHLPPRTIPQIYYAYIHIHVCIHTHIHTMSYIHVYIHAYICTHTYIHTYACIHIHAYINIHTYIYRHTYIYMYVCKYTMYACIYTYMYMYAKYMTV